MNRRDPRIRQTLDNIQSNLETANLNAQASLYDFTQQYLHPCLQSTRFCLESACAPCFGPRRPRSRPRHSSRGSRPELSFDFYNDLWEEEFADDDEATERTGLLSGWAAPDLDRLLAGSGASGSEQPRRSETMNYGSRGPPSAGLAPGRGRSNTAAKGGEVDPTEVPASSMFGFLESLPWKIGRRGLRYKPSAANLQENPHRKSTRSRHEGVHQALLEDEADELEAEAEVGESSRQKHRRGLSAAIAGRGTIASNSSNDADRPRANGTKAPASVSRTHSGHGRTRSSTSASHATLNSLSSRGDLFPSDDEDDAVPLDDEFASALERRTTRSVRRRSSGGDGGDEETSETNSRSESGARSTPPAPGNEEAGTTVQDTAAAAASAAVADSEDEGTQADCEDSLEVHSAG